MLRLARHHGAVVAADWELSGVTRTRSGFHLTSTHGAELEAHHLFVCAGGWLPELLDLLPLPAPVRTGMPTFTVRQEQAFHFPYREDVAAPSAWPTFIHKSEAIETYGLPGGRDAGYGGQKLAEFNGGRQIPTARSQNGRVDAANRTRVTDFARHHLPGVDPDPYAETTCLFTSTPTEDFLLDSHEGITLVSPCSGHGAKFAPLIGELAAGLATGRATVPSAFRAVPPLHRTA